MKNALINKNTKRICKVQEAAYVDGSYDTDIREAVSISNAKAETFESSSEPLFLINNDLMTLNEKIAYEKSQEREERFTETSDFLKARKILEIKNARDAEYTSILTTSDGLKFKGDLETVLDLKTISDNLSDGGSFTNYKCADGSYNTISKAQFQTAIKEGIERKSAAFAREKELSESVASASTFAELDAIVW